MDGCTEKENQRAKAKAKVVEYVTTEGSLGIPGQIARNLKERGNRWERERKARAKARHHLSTDIAINAGNGGIKRRTAGQAKGKEELMGWKKNLRRKIWEAWT